MCHNLVSKSSFATFLEKYLILFVFATKHTLQCRQKDSENAFSYKNSTFYQQQATATQTVRIFAFLLSFMFSANLKSHKLWPYIT